MADSFLTLADITAMKGSEADIGLVESVMTVAPEINVIKGVPINGITYSYTTRTELPAGPVFRRVNEGTDTLSSKYIQSTGECYFMDAIFDVDEALVKGQMAQGTGIDDILALEASGIAANKFIKLGDQFYRGTTADSKGFPGLLSFVDSTMELSAGGTGSATTSAWFIWNAPQGVRFVFGNGNGVNMGEWTKQLSTRTVDGATKKLMAHVNNMSGWIGLSMIKTFSVARIKNITSANPLTDALAYELLARFPVGQMPNHALMNPTALFYLQRARSAVSIVGRGTATKSGNDVFAQTPDSIGGVPITVTDSITSTETAS